MHGLWGVVVFGLFGVLAIFDLGGCFLFFQLVLLEFIEVVFFCFLCCVLVRDDVFTTVVLRISGGVITTTLLREEYLSTRGNMMISTYSITVQQAELELYITREAFLRSLFVQALARTKCVRCCISRFHVRSLGNAKKARVAETRIRFK